MSALSVRNIKKKLSLRDTHRVGRIVGSGTFTANGTTPVVVANSALTTSAVVIISLRTVGGTVGATPYVATVTPGTGFTTVATASNTSVYNYDIID